MRFYPHNISSNIVGQATSASLAQLTTYLNNFTDISVAVNTASLALNISGSAGTAGTDYTKTGDTGPVGDRGVTGPRGKSIYLLSGSWNTGSCTPVSCYEYSFGDSYVVGGTRYCDFGTPTSYYSTDSVLSAGSSPMYYNSICTSLAINVSNLGAYVSTAYSTNGSGILQTVDTCDESL